MINAYQLYRLVELIGKGEVHTPKPGKLCKSYWNPINQG